MNRHWREKVKGEKQSKTGEFEDIFKEGNTRYDIQRRISCQIQGEWN